MEAKTAGYVLIGLVFWLALLSFHLVRTLKHYQKLTRGSAGQSLNQILDQIITKQDLEAKQISQIQAAIEKQKDVQKSNFQRFSFMRYNPFEDTGGDQSFALAILDGKNNGIVISSLHSRNGTRVYAKEVTAAGPTTHQFSKEKKEVVKKAARHV